MAPERLTSLKALFLGVTGSTQRAAWETILQMAEGATVWLRGMSALRGEITDYIQRGCVYLSVLQHHSLQHASIRHGLLGVSVVWMMGSDLHHILF